MVTAFKDQKEAFRVAWEESARGNIVRLSKENCVWIVRSVRYGSLNTLIR